MKHKTLTELKPVADVTAIPGSQREVRRQRLERLAMLLEQHRGPLRLFSRIEYLPDDELRSLRSDRSPLSIACKDPVLRGQGLESDRLGEAMAFFGISQREAHHLLCDCHYYGAMIPPTPAMIAERARTLAQRATFREVWEKVRRTVTAWF